MNKEIKILIPGGAGLVGQNLVARLKIKGYTNIYVLDKHIKNLSLLKSMHPDVHAHYADLANKGEWKKYFNQAHVVVMLQAQIGGLIMKEFIDNNVNSTRNILNEIQFNNVPCLIHVSSSVVNSSAKDYYTETKKEQEELVIKSGFQCPILRPTLMFGWFDRKHLGWLARFMRRVPIFPIPGNGKFMRQPLFVGDFCQVIISCIENHVSSGIYDITGKEKIDYIDIIRIIKKTVKANTMIIKIPYSFFYILLWIWGLFDKNTPFTTQQLQALVAKDEFEVTNWELIFGVKYTPFIQSIEETYSHPLYSKVILEF
jgi:nucleoside-diphosphate-sugar epimerase